MRAHLERNESAIMRAMSPPGPGVRHRAPRLRVAPAAFLLAVVACCAGAEGPDAPGLAERWRTLRAEVIDPADGQFDVGPVLEGAHGFLPIPVIVTEPAVGYGGGLVALFVRPRHAAGSEGFARPNLSAVGGIATENGTRVLLAGDSSLWLDGRLKTTIGGVSGDINLDVYGLGTTTSEQDEAVRYTLAVDGAMAQVDWQVAPKSPWWIGVRFVHARIDPRLRDDPPFPGLEDRLRSTLAGPGVQLIYDTRDNVFTPTEGLFSETSAMVFDEAFGGSRDFRRYGQLLMGWWAAAPTVTVGVRGNYQQADGDVPFYARPFVYMRGIPAMRYPGDKVGTLEAELRWQFHGRWSIVAFGGGGRARIDDGLASGTQDAGAGGLGFRYEIAHKFGMHVGIDVARGPEDTAVYLQVGSAWARP
jgi:hypothetical protein